jgi:hypothetical protein
LARPKLISGAIDFLSSQIQEFSISKNKIDNLIRKLAVKEKRGESKKAIWYLL